MTKRWVERFESPQIIVKEKLKYEIQRTAQLLYQRSY